MGPPGDTHAIGSCLCSTKCPEATAAWGALCWVRILTRWSMVVATRQRERAAESASEWTRSLVQATCHCACALNVRPWCADLASTTTIEVGVEADILCSH